MPHPDLLQSVQLDKERLETDDDYDFASHAVSAINHFEPISDDDQENSSRSSIEVFTSPVKELSLSHFKEIISDLSLQSPLALKSLQRLYSFDWAGHSINLDQTSGIVSEFSHFWDYISLEGEPMQPLAPLSGRNFTLQPIVHTVCYFNSHDKHKL